MTANCKIRAGNEQQLWFGYVRVMRNGENIWWIPIHRSPTVLSALMHIVIIKKPPVALRKLRAMEGVGGAGDYPFL